MRSLCLSLLLLVVCTLPSFAGVNVLSGNLSHRQSLFSTSGGPMPLQMTLRYNSLDKINGQVGVGWSHAYDIYLHENSDGTLVLTGGVRKRFYFPDGNGNFVPRIGDHSSLTANTDGTYNIQFTSGRVYQFGTDKRIASITDRDGNQLTFDSSIADQVTVSDPAGRSAVIHTDTDGKVDWIQDPAGNQYDLAFDTNGQLQSVTYPAPKSGDTRPVWTYNYTAEGLLEYITDPNQQIRKFVYQDGKISRTVAPEGVLDTSGGETTDAANHSKSYAYESTTALSRTLALNSGTFTQTTLTEKDGKDWVYVYSVSNGVLLAKQNPLGHITEHAYYPSTSPYHGNKQYSLTPMEIDPSGTQKYRLTEYLSYDSNGNVLETQTRVRTLTVAGDGTISNTVNGPVDEHQTYTYATYNRPASITDNIRGTVTTMTYVDLGSGREQVTITAPKINAGVASGPQTVMIYRADGQVESITDPLGRTITYTYTSGQQTGVQDPSGITSTLGDFDPFGRAQLQTLTGKGGSGSRSTALQYDALSRLFKVTEGPAANQRITEFDYDGVGNRTAVIDAEGNETLFEHTSQGQVKKITNILNPGESNEQLLTTILEYGGAGCPSCGTSGDKLTAVTDARQNALGSGKKTIFTYDELGRVSKETDPENNVMGYTYFADGRLHQVFEGEPITGTLLLTYDYTADGKLEAKKNSAGTALSSYTYTAAGRLQTASTPDSAYAFTYYDNGWLKTVDNGSYVIEYAYDALGRRELMTLKQGASTLQTVDYVYDPTTKELKDIVSSSAGTFSFTTDNFGRRKTLSFPNGIVGNYSYDDANQANWLTGIDYTDGLGGSSILAIGYPSHDKVGNRKQRTEDGVATNYAYDDLYRVTQAKKGAEEENFVWDEVGNRRGGPTVKEALDTTYVHNAVNQMLQGRKQSYAYDARGNQTHRYLNAAKTKYWELTWSPDNTLEQARMVKDSQTLRLLQFKYDPFGRRIEKAVTQGTSSTTTTYIYDGENIVLQLENNSSGTSSTQYIHGLGIDQPLARVQGADISCYHADGLGSIVALTDSSKTIVQQYVYDTFGVPIASNTDLIQPYQYTSREWDRELGLYYYRARYYDPMEGRFIAKDPIGFDDGYNLYSYVHNNPIMDIDPSGKRTYGNPRKRIFIPPSKLPCDPFIYCRNKYDKKVSNCKFSTNAGCLENARTWFNQCTAWSIDKPLNSPCCKENE